MMAWLSSLPAWIIVIGALVLAGLAAALGRWMVRVLVPDPEQDQVPAIAAPLMPALGAAFAVLVALTLSSEAGYLRAAQDNVAAEAAAASKLAWAATTDGIDDEPIHVPLLWYLEATRSEEWRGDGAAEGTGEATRASLAELERAVRAAAESADLGSAQAGELLTSLDSLTAARRQRIAAAGRDLPVLYFLTLLVSGLALVANAAALTFRSSARTALLIGGLACVVALSLALLLALSGLWRGSLTVSGSPIDEVVRDLRDGFFRS